MFKLEKMTALAMGLLACLLAIVLIWQLLPTGSQPLAPDEEPAQGGYPEVMTARVLEIKEQGIRKLDDGTRQAYQKLRLRVESGSLRDQEVLVEDGRLNITSQERFFQPGDRVYLEKVAGPQGDHLYIGDYVRTRPLLWIAVLFVALVALMGGMRGLRSLVGTAFSLLVIFTFVVPQIISGQDPLTVSLIGSLLLLTFSTYVTYGWTAKAHAAVAGMTVSLFVTAILAINFVDWTRLSGLGADESMYLVMQPGAHINLHGLVLGGIIIGSLGVLDDICVSQASAVHELAAANRDLDWLELFLRSLNIGRDHISAMVNTLLLAYAGASMPLLLVFALYQEPLLRRLSREAVSEEIVRTLAGSIGLILAVPITSLMASLLVRWESERSDRLSERLLQLLTEGKARRIPHLARLLGTQPATIETLLEHLAEAGYLRLAPGQCTDDCSACPLAVLCAAGDNDRVWTLTSKAESEHRQRPTASSNP